jgi:hypothetical protein
MEKLKAAWKKTPLSRDKYTYEEVQRKTPLRDLEAKKRALNRVEHVRSQSFFDIESAKWVSAKAALHPTVQVIKLAKQLGSILSLGLEIPMISTIAKNVVNGVVYILETFINYDDSRGSQYKMWRRFKKDKIPYAFRAMFEKTKGHVNSYIQGWGISNLMISLLLRKSNFALIKQKSGESDENIYKSEWQNDWDVFMDMKNALETDVTIRSILSEENIAQTGGQGTNELAVRGEAIKCLSTMFEKLGKLTPQKLENVLQNLPDTVKRTDVVELLEWKANNQSLITLEEDHDSPSYYQPSRESIFNKAESIEQQLLFSSAFLAALRLAPSRAEVAFESKQLLLCDERTDFDVFLRDAETNTPIDGSVPEFAAFGDPEMPKVREIYTKLDKFLKKQSSIPVSPSRKLPQQVRMNALKLGHEGLTNKIQNLLENEYKDILELLKKTVKNSASFREGGYKPYESLFPAGEDHGALYEFRRADGMIEASQVILPKKFVKCIHFGHIGFCFVTHVKRKSRYVMDKSYKAQHSFLVFCQERRLFVVDPAQTFPVNYTSAFERFFASAQQPWYQQLAPRVNVYRFWAQSLTNGFEESVGKLLRTLRNNNIKLPSEVLWIGEKAGNDLSMYCGGFSAFLAAWLLDFMRQVGEDILTDQIPLERASLELAAQAMFKTKNPIMLNACMRKWLTSLEPEITA